MRSVSSDMGDTWVVVGVLGSGWRDSSIMGIRWCCGGLQG